MRTRRHRSGGLADHQRSDGNSSERGEVRAGHIAARRRDRRRRCALHQHGGPRLYDPARRREALTVAQQVRTGGQARDHEHPGGGRHDGPAGRLGSAPRRGRRCRDADASQRPAAAADDDSGQPAARQPAVLSRGRQGCDQGITTGPGGSRNRKHSSGGGQNREDRDGARSLNPKNHQPSIGRLSANKHR